ncbi:response regulator [Wenxinia saemankumensis]|uniref:Two component transcriptional regulator, LuxR family n=1 Tax=Wenxinia saemankumensis TaxID=1447782 RepID=A0A1M6AFP1_9RHOB|nr:response regulator transcription factor [Wenxinia saemankumensis]SHI35279.1 two component transcriptional regulator, LuxR family [Wenxinia saemankumensis]
MTPIRVLIADDHPLYRDGVARTLAEAGFDIAGEAATADEAVAMAAALRPDLVLLDISMPGGGIAAAGRIAALPDPPRIAMLTVSEEGDDVVRALKGGAIGYVLKGVGGADLAAIARELAAGRTYVAPNVAGEVLRALSAPRPAARAETSPLDELTRREEDILRRVARGQSNREVAAALGLQEKTVKHYMTAILQKLQVRNRTEAALLARDRWS